MKAIANRLTQVARMAALAFAVLAVGSAWAATAPSITVDGANVTVHNDNGTQWDNAAINTMSSYQNTTFTIPSGTGLASGAKVLVSSISIGCSSSQPGYMPAKLSLTVGSTTYVSKTATVTTGGFTSSGKNKYTYSFDGKYCILTVGTAASLKWINEDGSELQGYAAFGLVKDGHQFISRISWSGSVPVTEVTGKIVTVATGAQSDIKNTDVTPKCLQDVTGWISTATASTGEIILLNGSNGYGLSVNNANSLADNNKNRVSVWSKLSGNGTLTTADNNWQTPALKIYDASDFTGSINASAGNVRLAVIFCAETDTFSPSVYDEIGGAGKYNGRIYIKPGTSVTVAEGATWTAVNGIVNKGNLTVNGTVASAISNVGGTVTVNEGATLASFGSTRDFTGITVDPSVPVKITMTTEEYGKGSLSISGASGISTITVLAPDGTTTVGTITPAESSTLETGVKVSGKACWIDYEMSYGNEKTGFENTGVSSLVLQKDSEIEGSNAFTDDGMLYTYAHPFRKDLTMPSTWTAVVRCTVPNYSDAAVIIFGWNNNYIGLVAGETPKTEMRLVQYKSGYDHYVTNAVMTVQDATTAQHVYIFAVENSQTLKVYCDGSMILNKVLDEQLTITSGFQIGSVLGGVTGGIVRFAKDESPANTLDESVQKNARIDCVRLYDYSLSADQIAALSIEFPAVKLYEATVEADADTTWRALAWSNDWDGGNEYSKVLLTVEGDATVALPESITAEELAFDVEPGSTLTLNGPGYLAVTRAIDAVGFTLKLGGTVTFATDTTFAGNVVFASDFAKAGEGAIQLANGATVGVEDALIVTPLGSYTCAQGTVVDSAYTGDGVKLIPLTSAVVSITQSGTTQYYSSVESAFSALMASTDEAVVFTLLTGDVDAETATTLQAMNYYVSGNTATKAVAKIVTTTYDTLAAAVGAATDGATVTLLRASSEAITLNKAITLSETANFSGTLTGTGTLTFAAFRHNPTITFTDWTGTVVLPSFAAQATVLNKYGVTGSTVVLKGITGGWLGETSAQKMDVAPVLQLDGNVTIKGFSTSWDYTFAELAGTGNFVLDPTDNSPQSATITKVADDFTGTITNSTTVTLTIGTLARQAGTSTEPGTLLLSTGGTGDVAVEAVTIGGEPVDVTLVTCDDGIYVAAASVTKDNVTTPYKTVSAAVQAVGDDPATITLHGDTTSDISLAAGQTLDTNGFDVGEVTTTVANSYVEQDVNVYSVESYKTVTFVDEDGTTVLQTVSNLKLGDTPEFTETEPTKAATAQYTYTFTGWDDGTTQYGPTDALPAVTGDATYTATYTETVNTYTITWIVDETSDTTQVAYGAVPTYTDPVKQYYTFTGWDPTPVAVDGAATYTATFSRNTVTVTVPTVDNASVNVAYTAGGVSQTGTTADTYTVDQGTAVIVTYTAGEGYFFGNDTSKVVEIASVEGDTAVLAEQAGSTTAAVAWLRPANTPYSTLMNGLLGLYGVLSTEGVYLEVTDTTVATPNEYGTDGIGYDSANRIYAKSVARIAAAGYLTVQAAIDAAADGATVILQASSEEALTLANNKTVTIIDTVAATTYTYAAPVPVTEGAYTIDTTPESNGTTYTARDWYIWTLSLGTHPNATVTGLPAAVSEGAANKTVSFTVAADATYKITAVKVDGVAQVGDNGTYTYTVSGDAIVTVETELDVKTFTVVVPENTTVTVTGATANGDGSYTATIGDTVTITYAAAGAYVAGGTQSQNITVGADTESIAAPTDYTTTAAVAQIGSTYYADLATALNAGKGQGTTVTLLADVDLNGVAWTPVGTAADPFRGTFDGGNHTIRNLSISYNSAATSGATHAGLFGDVNGGTILNVRMENVTITNGDNPSEQPTASYGGRYGAIVGLINGGSIDSCTVKNVMIKDMGHIGGIAGANTGNTTISDCLVDGTIQLASGSNQGGGWDVGGIIGKNQSGSITVMNCQVDGTDAANSKIYSQYAAGGIVGFTAADSISGCAVKNVTVEAGANAYDVSQDNRIGAGGIIGCLKGTVSGCELDGVTVKYTDTAEGAYAAVGLVGGAQEGSAAVTVSGITVKDSAAYWGDTRVHQLDPGRNTNTAKAAPVVTYTDAPVAVIGMNYYNSLDAAVDAAQANDTVTLLQDITYGADREVTVWMKPVNIDLGGHTLTTNSEVSKDAGNNGYKAAAICFSIPQTSAGSITISNGTIITAYGAGVYADDPGLTLTLSNLTIQAATVGTQATAEYSAAVRVTGGSRVVIESGSYSGAYAAAASNSGADFTINGGTFSGPIFFSASTNSGKTKSIAVTGGTFTNSGFVNTNKGTMAVSGGTFDVAVPLECCADGYIPKDNGGGIYGVELGWVITFDVEGVQTQVPTAAGETPAYDGTPAKAEDDAYTYTFAGWTPTIVAATEAVTYTATFTPVAKFVTFTVPSLANATVSAVTGATATGNANEYTATIGAAVEVTYTANDGYVFAGGATTTTVNWTAAASAAPAAPASAPVVAVASITGADTTYYATFAEAIAAAEAMSPVPAITVLDATAEQTNDGWMFTQDGQRLVRKVAMVTTNVDNYATTNYYASAAEAFSAAESAVANKSGTGASWAYVTLLADDTLPGDATTVLKSNHGSTDRRYIDLNGHTLTAPKGISLEYKSGGFQVYLQDGSAGQTGRVVNPTADAPEAFVFTVGSSVTLAVEGGAIVAKGEGTALKTTGGGSITLKCGSVTADPAGRALSAAGTNKITAYADSSVSVTGTLGASTGVLNLQGGTFTANAANGKLFDVGETGSVAVSGGSFSSAVPAECIATGYVDAGQTAVVAGYYTVKKEVYTITFLDENDTEIVTLQVPYNDYYKDHTDDGKIPAIPVKASDDPAFYYTGAWSPAVTTSTRATGNATHKLTYTLGKYNFQYGDGLYTNTFANAYKNVADGGTITVCTEAFALTSTTLNNGKSVTVDLNGSTLSMNNTGMLTVSGEGTKVTFANGTVKYGSGTTVRDALVKVTSPVEVAFEGVTLQGASYYTTAVSVASGASAAFSGECVVTMPSGKQAVTAADGGTVAISGGMFSTPIPKEYCAEGYIPVDNGDGTYGVVPGFVTFTVVVPANTVVTVTGATLVEGNTYRANTGDEVTISYAADGAFVASGTKTQTLTPSEGQSVAAPEGYVITPAVAQVGDDYYATLAEAVAAAQDGDTITMLVDEIELTSTIEIDKDLKIDLGISCDIIAKDCRAFWVKAGHFTLTGIGVIRLDQLVDENDNPVQMTLADSSSVIRVGSNDDVTSFTLDGSVYVTSDYCYGITYFGAKKQTVVIDGTVEVTGNQAALSGNGSAAYNTADGGSDVTVTVNGFVSSRETYAIYSPETGTLTINGWVEGMGGIEVKAGTVTIGEYATITSYVEDEEELAHTTNNNGTSTTGYAIAAIGNANYVGGPTVTIEEGATIEGFTIALAEANASAIGTVTAKSNALKIPAGYKWVETANGYELAARDYVAQVGIQKFESLAEAMAAAQDGDTVTLLADVSLTERLFVNAGATPAYAGSGNRYATTGENKAITLDLNGFNITSTSNIALAGGSLTIIGTGTIETADAGLAPVEVRGTGSLASKRTLTVGSGVTLAGGAYGLNVFGSNDAQKNVIDVTVDGTVEGTLFVLGNLKNAENEINIVVNGTVTVGPADPTASPNMGIALNGNANVTVNDGAVVSGESGIEVRAGSLTVNGGTITATASAYSYKANGSGSTTRGAAISVAQHTTVLPTAVTLNGGTLAGVEKVYVKEVNAGMPDVTVQATAAYTQTAEIPEGYKWVETANGYELKACDYVAQIGDTKYETLAEAVRAAVSGETVILLTSCEGEGIFLGSSNAKTVTIDFGGFTYTVVTPVGSSGTVNQMLHFEAGNTVTLMNGRIEVTDDAEALAAFEMVMQNYCNLTIEGMTIDGTGIAVATYSDPKYQAYPVWYNTAKPQFNYNGSGTSVISDSTITVVGDFGIDDTAKVTIEGDALINANKIATKGTDERYASANPTITVKNGAAFSFDCSAILADDQNVVEEDGVYTVTGKTYVAQIGTTKYETLVAAISAANAAKEPVTIELLSDYDLETNEPGHGWSDMYAGRTRDKMIRITGKDITFDLCGHTLSNMFNNAICVSGTNISIINGEMRVGNLYTGNKPCSYALFVEDATNLVIDDLVTYGGINISHSTATINDLEFTGTAYYGVCAQNASSVTINSGSYYKAVAGSANYLLWIQSATDSENEYPGVASEMFIKGGKFKKGTSTFVLGSGVKPVITGGIFDFDATSHGVVAGYAASANTDETTLAEGYTYMVSPITYSVTFDKGNAGDIVFDAPEVTFTVNSGKIVLPSPGYAYEDHTFAAWKDENGDTVTAIPAGTIGDISLTATWTAAKTVEITVKTAEQEQGDDISAPIKVTDAWVENNVSPSGESATSEEIQDELNKQDENGLKKWQNYVLGQAVNAAAQVVSTENSTETVAEIDLSFDVPSVDTGFDVTYRMDRVTEAGAQVEKGDEETSTPLVDLTQVETNAYFQVKAIITPKGDAAAEKAVEVEVQKVVGVMAVNSTMKNTIVAVPWESFAGDSITAGDLVYTGNRKKGDTLTVYVAATGRYKTWTLDADGGNWASVTTYSMNSAGDKTNEAAGDATDQSIPRGAGVWVYRKDVSEKIYLLGQKPADATAAAPLEAGSADKPKWNLVASPSVEEFNPNKTETPVEGATSGDQIVVPSDDATPIMYEFDASAPEGEKWGYNDLVVEEGKPFATPVRRTNVKVPAGTGFWYLNKSNKTNINLK